MAYDGIITRAMVLEMRENLLQGKIDKVHQPTKEELVISVHSKTGNKKIYASVNSSAPRVTLTEDSFNNPPTPYPFCMLLRKHLTGGRIISIDQVGSDRIIEISLEAMNELGFTLSKKIIFEIMGKHSNVIVVDIASGKVIDSIKRISIDTSRARQILPGIEYQYPPSQDKTGFDEITEAEIDAILKEIPLDSSTLQARGNALLKAIGGISPQVAEAAAVCENPYLALSDINTALADYFYGNEESGESKNDNSATFTPHVYFDENNSPVDFHIAPLPQFEESCKRKDFDTLSACINYYFDHKDSTNRTRQQSNSLIKTVSSLLDKNQLKLQRLNEDLLAASDSDKYRLYGELLTANLHLAKQGMDKVTVTSYYDGSQVEIPLDIRYAPSKNAQNYFKKYGKAKTAVKEKQIQIEETEKDIEYLDSVLTFLYELKRPEEIEGIRAELIESGFLRKKKTTAKNYRFKAAPIKYESPSGFQILVGRNNKENDELTLKIADRTDIWLHTKDIPGSHVILRTEGKDPEPEDIYAAASIAAWHSKAKNSGQVPVDYVKVRYVKKPAGAKPGMVIFTDNRTVYVDPKLP